MNIMPKPHEINALTFPIIHSTTTMVMQISEVRVTLAPFKYGTGMFLRAQNNAVAERHLWLVAFQLDSDV
jgi:hypothetical protein